VSATLDALALHAPDVTSRARSSTRASPTASSTAAPRSRRDRGRRVAPQGQRAVRGFLRRELPRARVPPSRRPPRAVRRRRRDGDGAAWAAIGSRAAARSTAGPWRGGGTRTWATRPLRLARPPGGPVAARPRQGPASRRRSSVWGAGSGRPGGSCAACRSSPSAASTYADRVRAAPRGRARGYRFFADLEARAAAALPRRSRLRATPRPCGSWARSLRAADARRATASAAPWLESARIMASAVTPVPLGSCRAKTTSGTDPIPAAASAGLVVVCSS
jgi:hypothetical protein